jgi:hypothetical protein
LTAMATAYSRTRDWRERPSSIDRLAVAVGIPPTCRYEEVNDAGRLRRNPAWAGWSTTEPCLGQPDGSLRDRWLFQPENLTALADLLNLQIDKMHNRPGDRADNSGIRGVPDQRALGVSIELSAIYYLYSIDPRAVWKGQLALMILVAAAAAAKFITLNPESRGLRRLKHFGVAGIAVMVALQFAVLVRYLFYPSYLNHVEAITAAVSWLGWEGYPLYPRLDGGDVYGLQYGPVLFQVTGFFLWLLGPSIGASKIPGLMAFALSQVLSFVTLRRAGASVAEALTMTGVQCVVLAGFTDQGYVSGVRSDALLFLAAQTAVLVAPSAPTVVTAGVLGLLGGMCVNLKIHGALYVLPAFVYHLSRSPSSAAGLRLTGVAGSAAAIALAVPFGPSNVSLVEYYLYFQMLKQHPWERWLFEQNIVFEAMCLAPLLLLFALFTPKLSRAFNWFMAALVLCMTMMTFPAAVSGAGPHHLLPFLPSLLWGLVVIRHKVSFSLPDVRAKGRYEGFSLGLIVALLFGYGPIVIASWGTVLRRFADTPLVSEAMAEIEGALKENPGLKIAVGPGSGSFDAQMLRVIPVFHGNPLPIDSSAWLDLEADGISDEIVRRAIRECRVDLWLLPSGAPFVTISHYHGRNIYSEEVLADFHAAYMKQVSGRVFDQWRCKRRNDS